MTYITTWREALKGHLAQFAPLVKQDKNIDLVYGIVGGAVLWGVREAPFDDAQKAALREACGDEKHLPHLLKALGGWDEFMPLEAARTLSKRQQDNDDLRAAIDAVIRTMSDILLSNQAIRIEGNVSGGNVNFGTQIFAGDFITQQIRERVITCPTAPNPPEHFTGRTRELQDLRQALTSGERVAITAVRAIGGMGKTSLAQALCHQADSLFDAVLWAEIHEEPQTINILLDWARYAVDDYALPPDAKAEDIANWVRGQLTQLMQKADGCGTRWLVVFDDVWNTPASYESVRLLQSALPPDTRQLITTRQLDTATQLQARPIELHALTDDEALALMRKLTTHAALTDTHLTRAITLIKGHPLTLEIAAASLNEAEDAADLMHILDEYERGIRDGSPFDALRLDVETPRALNVVFGRSYKRLSEADQQRFRALGVMPTDARWTRAIAGGVWGESDPAALTKAHKTLRLAAFIQQDEQASAEYGDTCYTLHPLLRAYARALLDESGETDAVFLRYAAYFTQQSEQFRIRQPETWRDIIERDVLHILSVGNGLVERQNDPNFQAVAMEFAFNTTNFVLHRTEHQCRAWLDMGFTLSHIEGSARHKGLFLNELGLFWRAKGEPRKALEYFQQALLIVYNTGVLLDEATVLNNIGLVWDYLGDKHKAMGYYEQALVIRRAIGDCNGEAATLHNIGALSNALGELNKSLEYYQQALLIRRLTDDRAGEAETLNNIGGVYYATGDSHKALEYLEQALSIIHAVGDRAGEATTLNNIGMIWDKLGQKHKALEYYEQALPIHHAVGNRAGEATTLNNMGSIYFQAGDLLRAVGIQRQVIEIDRAVQNVTQEAASLFNLAVILAQMGERDEAITLVQQSIALLEHHNLPRDAGGGTIAMRQQFIAQLTNQTATHQQSALSGETLNTLAVNSYAVMTTHKSKRSEWQQVLERNILIAKRDNDVHELAFFEALVAILAGERPTLPEDNPYAGVVQQVLQAIDDYHKESGT